MSYIQLNNSIYFQNDNTNHEDKSIAPKEVSRGCVETEKSQSSESKTQTMTMMRDSGEEERSKSKSRNQKRRENVRSNCEKKLLPGQSKSGVFPSSNLTAPSFTKLSRKAIPAQKYPCYIPQTDKKVDV